MELIVPDVKIDFKEMISGFAFPLEIKNDIIYCQKSLRTYIKAHQIIVARLGNNAKLPSIRKNLDDLEKEICEINAEQKLLLIRLRVALEEYYISLRNDNIDVDPEAGNGYVSRIFSGCIDDPNYLCEPISVKRRLSEKELLAKYMPDEQQKKIPEPVELIRNFINMNSRQISLLKPKAERFAQKSFSPNIMPETSPDSDEKLQKARRQEQEPCKQEKEQEEKLLTLTSPAINNSRMRLLQALRKAQTMNALKTKQQSSTSFSNKRSYEVNSPQSSTSEESPDTRETSPLLSDEPSEPTEYTQEMFLRIFGLHTLEQSKYLTQRRSKRKRRVVQNNEKSDYHYGNLDLLDNTNRVEKKKKEYLPSGPSTRGRKRKIIDSDRDVAATSSKISSDRSTSSSPTEEKVRVICTECLKEGDTPLCRCENCNGMFHMKCQKGSIIKQPTRFREKCCPTCYRIKQKELQADEEQQQPSDNRLSELRQQSISLIENRYKLMEEYNVLHKKYESIYIRNRGLVKRSDIFKTKLNKLFHIVESFK